MPQSSNTPSSDDEPPPSPGELDVDITIDSDVGEIPLDPTQIQRAVRTAAQHRGYHLGNIGIRITTDETIRGLNAEHLGHDYATDVISFGYGATPPVIEGELVASIDTARHQAEQIGWPAEHELLLYIVHGVLHITEMDDHDPSDRAAMRDAETAILLTLGIDDIVRYGADRDIGREDHR
ncbi:MAG: rRNA maturation RNase YbeY [Pirellulaceae bacterium]|nr:rRNA maturation RNase YbeY [Pirellulaceae bacterium]